MGSLHQLHNADTVEEEESENELSTNQAPDMAATTDQPSTDAKVIQPTQDIIGQNTGNVTTGAVRFKDSDQADAGKSDHTVNGQGVRPKAKQLHRKNTPATLPTVQKLCKEAGHSEAVLEEEEEEEQEEHLQGATGGS